MGDNDTLGAIVACSVGADLLVLLSDIEGLYTADPRKNPDAQSIRHRLQRPVFYRSVSQGHGSLGSVGFLQQLHCRHINHPRGGAGLIRACVDNAAVPVLETGTGICHVYVDTYVDMDMALDIIENAKCSRPSVCNAAEVCLVHREVAGAFLPTPVQTPRRR